MAGDRPLDPLVRSPVYRLPGLLGYWAAGLLGRLKRNPYLKNVYGDDMGI